MAKDRHRELITRILYETAALVDVSIDPEIERDWSRNVSPTRLVVETSGGSFEARVDRPRGDAGTPMSRQEFDAKMEGCLEISGIGWPSDVIAQLREAIDGLDGRMDARELVACLTVGTPVRVLGLPHGAPDPAVQANAPRQSIAALLCHVAPEASEWALDDQDFGTQTRDLRPNAERGLDNSD